MNPDFNWPPKACGQHELHARSQGRAAADSAHSRAFKVGEEVSASGTCLNLPLCTRLALAR
jgi:hypothetical protein